MPNGIQFGVTLEAPRTEPLHPRLNIIRTEGDSLMDGAHGISVRQTLSALLGGFALANTAVGTSTMDDIVDRVALPANANLLPQTTVFWDGSQNGITTVSEYVDLLGSAILMLGHDRFVVIPPIMPYGSTYSGSEQEEIAIEMQSRWPDNFLDWKDWLDNAGGDLAASEAYEPGVDNIHLSQAGIDHISIGIARFLRDKAWLDEASNASELLPLGAWGALSGAILSGQSDAGFRIQSSGSDAFVISEKVFSGFVIGKKYRVTGSVNTGTFDKNILRVSTGATNSLADVVDLQPTVGGAFEFTFIAPAEELHLGFGAQRAAFSVDCVYSDISIKAPDDDELMLSSGSLWLFDPSNSNGSFSGVPGNADVLPNVAWNRAADEIGSGDATTLGTHVTVIDTNAGADIFAERSGKNGLHVILSQDSNYVGSSAQGFRIEPNAAIQSYLDAHTDDDWYFSVWFAVTRNPSAVSTQQSPMHKASNTGNYLFHMQRLGVYPQSGSTLLGSASLPVGSEFYGDEMLGEALFRAVGTTGYTGTQPSLANGGLGSGNKGLGVTLGSFGAWSSFNDGKAPSLILYRAYAENLAVSGRSYAQAGAIDQILWRDAFSSNGRFGGDSWSDPDITLA